MEVTVHVSVVPDDGAVVMAPLSVVWALLVNWSAAMLSSSGGRTDWSLDCLPGGSARSVGNNELESNLGEHPTMRALSNDHNA